eukprot:PITA_21998
MWNYVETTHKATSVTHSCVGSFTSPHDIDLIIAKCSRIEIHLFTPQGLQPLQEAGEIISRVMGDISNRIGHPTECRQMRSIDPDCRLIALHLYVAALNAMPLDSKGELEDSFNISLEELQVLDIKFLYGCPHPTIAMLYEDYIGRRNLKTYVVDLRNRDFKLGPWLKVNLDRNSISRYGFG